MHSDENHMVSPPGIYKNWYNFSDITDKVAFNYTLAEDFSENSNGIAPIDFLVENDYEIEGEHNPHKSYGYLRTADFAKVLNGFITSETISLGQKIARRTNQIVDVISNKISIQKSRIKNTLNSID